MFGFIRWMICLVLLEEWYVWLGLMRDIFVLVWWVIYVWLGLMRDIFVLVWWVIYVWFGLMSGMFVWFDKWCVWFGLIFEMFGLVLPDVEFGLVW